MKKILLFMVPAIMLVFLITSCKKEDTNTAANNSTAEGTWSGTGQYGTAPGTPTYSLTINFKANGTVDINGHNNAAIDVATGTWQMVQDSVKATYTYLASSATYTLSAKYTANANTMVGTIGLGSSTSGVGLFSVNRQP